MFPGNRNPERCVVVLQPQAQAKADTGVWVHHVMRIFGREHRHSRTDEDGMRMVVEPELSCEERVELQGFEDPRRLVRHAWLCRFLEFLGGSLLGSL